VLTVPSSSDEKPRPIRSILLAHDFSVGADLALRHAMALAAHYEAVLHVVHAWEPSPLEAREPTLAQSRESDARRELEDAVRRHPTPTLRVIARHVRRGIPYQEIVAAASELGADLVVCGSTGKSRLEHLLLGSVAERVVRSSPVPVLTVREPPPAT
jgi:nucleotide-binding universal stress UspA family protein